MSAHAQAVSGNEVEVQIDGRVIRLTNLDRVLYPDGFTKADVIAHYLRVGPAIVPHLRDRPLTMRRFPEGVAGTTWFQTRCRGRPDWMASHPIVVRRGEVHEYCVVNDLASLVWVAQMGTLELHPFTWRTAEPDRPTAIVFDLDPGPPAGSAEACRVALRLREALDGRGLVAVAKSSGGRGIHLYAPSPTGTTYADAKALARELAADLAAERPDQVLDSMDRAARAGRAFIDWGQNDPGSRRSPRTRCAPRPAPRCPRRSRGTRSRPAPARGSSASRRRTPPSGWTASTTSSPPPRGSPQTRSIGMAAPTPATSSVARIGEPSGTRRRSS